MKRYGVTIQVKPLQQYLYMVLFIYLVVVTVEFVNEILWFHHSNETSSVVLSHSTIQSRPQGFPLKKWVGPPFFLREKPWGRGWVLFI